MPQQQSYLRSALQKPPRFTDHRYIGSPASSANSAQAGARRIGRRTGLAWIVCNGAL